jgi:hypothetical protein
MHGSGCDLHQLVFADKADALLQGREIPHVSQTTTYVVSGWIAVLGYH